jgi:predicted unusual protein kinase regulating ubiquinone biosynthesis (AarF/ABC1/UbiB family)
VPIASGSVSQVYKAKLHGKKVAVKVRHPEVGINLSRDIDLLFSFSRFLSFFSKFFEIPVTHESLKRILSEQLSFLKEKRNIDKFNSVVVDRNLSFPITYP